MVDTTIRLGEVKAKPNLVRDYNQGMSDIDRSDQILCYNSALRKTIRWYKKVGVHFIEMFLINGFVSEGKP